MILINITYVFDKIFYEEATLKICTEGFKSGTVKNVCTMLGSWQDHNRLYFAMEHLPNRTLYYACAEDPDTRGVQTPTFCQFYGTEMARGITFLNERHIIHRDLKLENIAVDKHGHARLIDFGIAVSKQKTSQIF